ncbi:hypothetical protein DINM_006564 [Dirofilaria immitis]|nr:hypothetical protein [Dirofilaria immitis]
MNAQKHQLRLLPDISHRKEDIVILNDGGAIIEKGLVLHGCKPSVRVGDIIIAVNDKQFDTNEDLTQLLTQAAQSGTKLTLTVNRQKSEVEADNKIDRYILVEKVNGIAAEGGVVNVHVPYESGDVLGITVKDLIVTKIQDGSIGEAKFELEDKLMDINGVKLREDEQLYDLLQRINVDLEINVMRNMAPCEALGVRPDENLMISRIMDKSHAQGRFELGDDRNQFFKLFEDATVEGRIIVERSAERELELEKRLLPPNIEKIIKRHAGFDYIIVNVRYDSSAGRPFGLNIANVTAHKIIIPEVTENTVAGDYLKIYDHIIAINGNPVSDVTAVIERPVTLESNREIKREVEDWKRRMARPINLEQMPLDVQEIVEKHFKQREVKQITKLVSVLRKPTGQQRKIHFSEHHIETQIQSDIPATKRLRSCR